MIQQRLEVGVLLCVYKELYNELLASNRGKVEGKQNCSNKIDHDAIKTDNLSEYSLEYSFSIPIYYTYGR